MRRTSVSLTADQERAIEEFSQPGPYRDELIAWAGSRGFPVGKSLSLSLLISVLVEAGIEHVRTRSVEIVYTELAGVYVDEGLPHEIKALRAETDTADTADDGGATGNGGAIGDDAVAGGDPRGRDSGGAAAGGAGGRVGARR